MEKNVLFASSGGHLEVEVLGETVSKLGGNQESLQLECVCLGLSSATTPGCLFTGLDKTFSNSGCIRSSSDY